MSQYHYYEKEGIKYKKAFTYNVSTAPAGKPLTLTEVKTHLKIAVADVTEDDYLNLLIDVATAFGEKYTKRTFINTGFTTYRDDFNDSFLLRRSKTSAIGSIKYLVDGVLTTLASAVYGFTDVTGFSEIFLNVNQVFPTNTDPVPQAVEIIFTAGYGATEASVPADVKFALLNHIADLYSNRGDCGGDCAGSGVTSNTKLLYDKIRIIDIGSSVRNYPSDAAAAFNYRF
jgi:uncharacterized phiE125 gp8 family phage protein